MNGEDSFAGWWPSIRIDDRIGWLPVRSGPIAEVMAAICDGQTRSVLTRPMPMRLFVEDPASLIWLLAKFSSERLANSGGGSGDHSATPRFVADELSCWWWTQARSMWRSTDWLACPRGEPSSRRMRRFAELGHYARHLSPRRWLAESELWLEAAGLPVEAKSRIVPNDLAFLDGLSGSPGTFGAVEPARGEADVHFAIEAVARRIDEAETAVRTVADRTEKAKRELAHRLAYGLSHEINNPLANISLRAQSLVELVDPPAAKRSLEKIVDQSARAHAMIADLMFYAKPPDPRAEPFDLGQRCQQVIEGLTETATDSRVTIEWVCRQTDPLNDPITVVGDAEMIGDAVAALVRNSIEAIGCDGTIRVTLFGSPIAAHANGRVNARNTVTIEVADSGPGITAEQAAQAFDPYFSGREAGRGLGLGLCRAERIVQLHGGRIWLTPAIAGCVAMIELPV